MIELRDIRKTYTTGDFTQVALDDASITFRENEFVAILGPSGSGKTTLLNIIGGLDHFDSGDIIIAGTSTKNYKDADWDTYRNHRIGFVFQSYNLIPHQSVASNVELALTLSGESHANRRERALEALDRVGLKEHADKLPNQLSGGQMQRVAIARALVNDPDIVLADEPTGALDSETGVAVMELLKEIAEDRLVVMVTHNPELAERYATRTVRLTDGRITSDTDPYTPSSEDAPNLSSKLGKAGMSVLTALQLSFANLMSKKGRTFMTAFAGSIGIIGIAAILALSNGVNDYIARTEEEAMSAYPLSISEASTDLSSFFTMRMSNELGGEEDEATENAAEQTNESEGSSGAASVPSSMLQVAADRAEMVDPNATIPESTVVSDMFASVNSNDLSALKAYFESEESNIQEHVNDIVYNYGIKPHFYSPDTSNGIVEVGSVFSNPNMTGMQVMTSLGFGSSGTSSFEEMVNNRELLESQYDVLTGRWPNAANEVVLVLNMRGRLTDYTLYSLGVLDPQEFRELFEKFSNEEEIVAPDTQVDLTYNEALDMTFKVVPAADLYQKNDQAESWTDMSDDETYMADLLADALELEVVGVIMPNEDNDSPTLSEGIAYTHGLTLELMGRAAQTEIVKEQIDNPERDVFTGETFEDLREGTASSFDLDNIFSIDQRALERAFSFDTSALSSLGQGLDLSGLNLDMGSLNLDMSNIQLDTSPLTSLITSDAIVSLVLGAPQPDFSDLSDKLDAAQRQALAGVVSNIANGFLPYWYQAHPGESLSDTTDLSQDVQAYLATEAVQTQIEQMRTIAGPEFEDEVEKEVNSYLDNTLVPYLQSQLSSIAQQAAQIMATQLASQLQAEIAKATQSLGSELSKQLSQSISGQMGDIASSLQNAFNVDASAFANAINFNMTQEDLTSLLSNYAQAEQLTYENNLVALGYAEIDKPRSIDIYPKSFDDKEAVLEIIDSYNDRMKAEGKDDQVITYSDIMGALLSSVSDIVNMISTVLIAFVSISLVVSSIMIGIITYISVLERNKEIGILRAMGASKFNIANIFNAEAFIEGLIAGVFAIAVVLAASVPVNAYVLETRNVANIMQLTPANAFSLILISVVLTLVASLIPSSNAARRDPVEALRSE